MTLHYVYVDSRNRNQEENTNDFTVHLHNPIKNVVKCGVTNFSKGNNSYNVTKQNKTITWTETHLAAGEYVSRYFLIELNEGYYGIQQLLTEIINKMNATLGRQVAAETKTTYSYTIDEDYRISIMATASTAAASNRWWAFTLDNVLMDAYFNNSILHQILNYDRNQIYERALVLNPLITDASKWRQSQSSLAPALRTLKANFSYTENQSVINLASNTLARHSQRMISNQDGQTSTMMTNVLEQIPVVVNRWSYIHLNRNDGDVQWHTIDNLNINHFDIKILNEHYQLLEGTADSHWKACIVFETNNESHLEIKDMYKEYNADAYRIAHRTR
eukprot:1033635-Prorocentrum_minimum.AAC.3